jgi:hypothetical protein
MTTVQESTNGHRFCPLPRPFPDSQHETQSEDSPNNNLNPTPPSPSPATETFPASAYHVPPKRFAPKAHAYRQDDFLDLPPETDPLPERCQFMFSDGRQCTMARSDIHPSLCTYHSDREDQLFGDPAGSFVTRKLDLPELYSACRDLTTAAGVSRALGQVFRLLAQHRISRQEAATFAKLGHLLLQSISAARSESIAGDNDQANTVILSSGESHGHQELSPVNKVQQRRISQNTAHSVLPIPPREHSPEPTSSHQNGNSSPQPVPSVNSSASQRPLETSLQQLADHNTTAINTSATSVCNSREINTSENVELKTLQNEHLQMYAPPAMSRPYRPPQHGCPIRNRQGRQHVV